MGPSGSLAVFAVCMIFGGVSAVDMSKVQPYNLTALVMFLQEDLDKDGVMSVAEIDAVFDKYDTNGDGKESRHEYTTMICSADPDLFQLSHYLYDDYDVNGDHHLTHDDFEAWRIKIDNSGDASRSKWHLNYQISTAQAFFTQHTASQFKILSKVWGNGEVTEAEFVNYWVKLFESIEGQAPVHGHSHEHGHCTTG